MTSPALILASTSIYRRALLQKLGLPFSVDSPAIDESRHTHETAAELALRLGIAKAQALQTHYPRHLLIGSDQVASVEQHILGKPGNRANAVQQLTQVSGKAVTFYTSVCVLDSASGRYLSAVDTTTVHFRQLSLAQIEHYLDHDQPYDCAGSFKAESLGIALFEKIQGDDPNALVGLPLIQLVQLLEQFGVQVL